MLKEFFYVLAAVCALGWFGNEDVVLQRFIAFAIYFFSVAHYGLACLLEKRSLNKRNLLFPVGVGIVAVIEPRVAATLAVVGVIWIFYEKSSTAKKAFIVFFLAVSLQEFVQWHSSFSSSTIDLHRELTNLIGFGIAAGPSGTGGQAFLYCFLAALILPQNIYVRLLRVIIISLVYFALVATASRLVREHQLTQQAVFAYMPIVISTVLLIVTASFRKFGFVVTNKQRVSVNLRIRKTLFHRLCFVSIAIGIVCIYVPKLDRIHRSSFEGMTIGIVTEDCFLDLDRPNLEETGFYKLGMFGCLSDMLASLNVETKPVELAAFASTSHELDALLIINPYRNWGDDELLMLSRYVESGGCLWVLGDHTDIMNTMGSLNQLLADYGIQFRFDSAVPRNQHWAGSLAFCHYGIGDETISHGECAISIGASLELSGASYPIISGKQGFSDWGDRSNERGAFLGGYQYEFGELIGDVALVAGSDHGKGRVLVFGDTSTLQNTAICCSLPLVSECLSWMKGGGESRAEYLLESFFFLIVIFGVVFVARVGNVAFQPVWLLLMITPGLLCNRSGTESIDHAITLTSNRAAVILNAPGFQLSTTVSDEGSVTGLMTTLLRHQFRPVLVSRTLTEISGEPELIFLIGARAKLSRVQTEQLMSYVENGGTIAVALTPDSKMALEPLLVPLGVTIAPVPLGPVPLVKEIDYIGPQFLDCWPLVFDKQASNNRVHFEWKGYALTGELGIGQGRILLFGDEEFFLNSALENMQKANLDNQKFLTNLINEHSNAK